MTEQEQADLLSLPDEIKALERQLRHEAGSGFGSVQRHNTERVLNLKRERLAALKAKAAGQEALL